ncbi:MAG: nitroreductase family protein [Desulfofustis sp.]|jgi:nitroreductase
MNEKLDFIFSRRSVRQFTEKPVSDSQIEAILQAGMSAPSARARDPWRFVVTRRSADLEMMRKIAPNGSMLKEAAAAFLVCGDIDQAHENQESYMLQDVAACIENMLLAINGLGLGGCWIGVHPRQPRVAGMRDYFKLPQSIIPIAAIALGYPAVKPAKRTRYRADYVLVNR